MKFYYHQSAKYPFQGIIYDDLTLAEAMQCYKETEPNLRLGAASIGIMTDDNLNIFEDSIDLMVGGKMLPMPDYPEYKNNPELFSAYQTLKSALQSNELQYRPAPHRYARTNRTSTALKSEKQSEKIQNKKPETIPQVKFTLDWLEIRRKSLDLYKEIYGKEGYSGMVYFDPNLCRIDACSCKGERKLPAGKAHCVTLLCFEKQRPMEEILCDNPEEAKMYISYAAGYCGSPEQQKAQWKKQFGSLEPAEVIHKVYADTPHVHAAYREVLGKHGAAWLQGQLSDYLPALEKKLAENHPELKLGGRTEAKTKSYCR